MVGIDSAVLSADSFFGRGEGVREATGLAGEVVGGCDSLGRSVVMLLSRPPTTADSSIQRLWCYAQFSSSVASQLLAVTSYMRSRIASVVERVADLHVHLQAAKSTRVSKGVKLPTRSTYSRSCSLLAWRRAIKISSVSWTCSFSKGACCS